MQIFSVSTRLDINAATSLNLLTAGATRVTVDNAGNVGIETASPSTNSRLAIKDGHLQSQQATWPMVTGNTGGYAGSLSNATDVAGKITITPAVAPGNVIVTFNQSDAVAPIIIVTPTNAAAGQIAKVYVTTTTFTINFTVSSNTNHHTYNYHVIETQ